MNLYERNCGAATSTPGLLLVKLQYEHLHLTFLKMRVDLAAQVCINLSIHRSDYHSILCE